MRKLIIPMFAGSICISACKSPAPDKAVDIADSTHKDLAALNTHEDQTKTHTDIAVVGSNTARAPERIANIETAIAWYEQHRDGVAGQFTAEREGDQLLVVWAPRPEGVEETQVSTYVRPRGFEEFFLSSDDSIQSIDYGDGVMRHFGEVRLYEHNGTIAYFVVPGVIYSHGSNLQEVADLIRKKEG